MEMGDLTLQLGEMLLDHETFAQVNLTGQVEMTVLSAFSLIAM